MTSHQFNPSLCGHNKQPVVGGADCKYQNIYLQWISVIYYTVHALVFLWRRQWRVSGSQIKGISHQVLPVIFHAPLFCCRGLGPSVLRGTRGTLKHLSTLQHSHTCVCVLACVRACVCFLAVHATLSLDWQVTWLDWIHSILRRSAVSPQ